MPNLRSAEPSALKSLEPFQEEKTTDHVLVGTRPVAWSCRGGSTSVTRKAEGDLDGEEEGGAPPTSKAVSLVDRAKLGVAAMNVEQPLRTD